MFFYYSAAPFWEDDANLNTRYKIPRYIVYAEIEPALYPQKIREFLGGRLSRDEQVLKKAEELCQKLNTEYRESRQCEKELEKIIPGSKAWIDDKMEEEHKKKSQK